MSWTSLITLLFLTSISAYMVMVNGWPIYKAFFTVAGITGLVVFLPVSSFLIRSSEEERQDFWGGFMSVVREFFRR